MGVGGLFGVDGGGRGIELLLWEVGRGWWYICWRLLQLLCSLKKGSGGNEEVAEIWEL